MNLMDLFIKIGVDDQATSKIGKITKSVGKGLATAAKVGAAAIGVVATGITALTKASIDNYAEYEQLVGGVETLFKSSAGKLTAYAHQAYKAQGISANQYMSLATSFSASLLQSLEGDTDAAVKATDLAITDMSDNANKMGTDIGMIQNAYQGFAKANYTMLDNLKLGYGGTQEEMKRLIADAAELSDTVDAQDMSFANIVEAIHVVQTEMGITGTTAKEAASTIQGSVGMMKAAWANLVTGIADENADLDTLITQFVESIGTVAQNIIPKISVALNGAAKLIRNLIPVIVNEIPKLISENLPVLVEAAIGIVKSLADGISDNLDMLVETVLNLVEYLANNFLTMLPQIVELGLQLIISLANGIAESLPTLIPTIVGVVIQIVQTLTNPETLSQLLNAAIAIIMALANYLLKPETINMLLNTAIMIVNNLVAFLMENLEPLLDAAINIIMALVDYILDPENLEKLVQTAIEIVVTIAGALVGAAGKLIEAAVKLIAKLIEKFNKTDWASLGKAIIDGLRKGIENAWSNLVQWFTGLFGDLIGIAKKILGIASPSKVFKKIGGFTAEGFGLGFDDEFANVKDDMEDAMSFDDLEVGANIHRSGSCGHLSGGNTFGDVIINIDGARYSDEKSLATAIAEALQDLTDRREAVYA